MTQKAQKNVNYTLSTHAAEHMTPSQKALFLCEEIADGRISGNAAVKELLRHYGIESRSPNV